MEDGERVAVVVVVQGGVGRRFVTLYLWRE